MTTIKIFLASSEELKPERLVIAELITKLNYLLAEYDITIRLIKWEYLDSSMGAQHKQEDYNDYLRECDMCIVLYWTKFGMYTEIELDTAYKLYISNSCLKKMAIMFKDTSVLSPDLQVFREKCEREHSDLCHTFMNVSHLKSLFLQQIIQSLQLIKEEEREKLAKNVRKLQKLLAITEEDEPEYKEYMFDLQSAKNDLNKNEQVISEIERISLNI